CAAARTRSLAATRSAARRTAPAPTPENRDEYAPLETVHGLEAVSTSVTTWMSCGVTPRTSAATCAATVACPWPCGVVDIRTVMPPLGLMATLAPSALP